MPKYIVNYSFNGYGQVKVKAKNEKEAREIWHKVKFSDNDKDEYGEDHQIEEIEKIN